MIANYGFEDGSGSYYIAIDTDHCTDCKERGCLKSCQNKVFEMELNDWDDEVAIIKKDYCNQLKSICAGCKPLIDRPELLPCEKACSFRSIVHTW